MSDLRAVTRSADETMELARRIGTLLRGGDVVLLTGDLGSGKTTFAKGIAAALEVTEPLVSPTFTIVREYEGRMRLVHVDVYRLDRLQELHDLGLDEVMTEDAVTLVEWGDVVASALPVERLEVHLDGLQTEAGDDERIVTLACGGGSWRARHERLADAVAIPGG